MVFCANQEVVDSNHDRDNHDEARRSWELGKSLGLYAENEDRVIEALAESFSVKNDEQLLSKNYRKRVGRMMSSLWSLVFIVFFFFGGFCVIFAVHGWLVLVSSCFLSSSCVACSLPAYVWLRVLYQFLFCPSLLESLELFSIYQKKGITR